jgi:tetratricopeptide (TPR) repeat protein
VAIYLPDSDCLILEVAKTGTKWVRSTLVRAGVKIRLREDKAAGAHGSLRKYGRKFSLIACFVRSPFSWYRSYWAYRTEGGWKPTLALDRLCGSASYATFIWNVFVTRPGFLTSYFASFAGRTSREVGFVGRQERLAEDLIQVLRAAGQRCDEDVIRSSPRENATTLRPEEPVYLRDLIALSEYEALSRYGYLDEWKEPAGLRAVLAAHPDRQADLLGIARWTERQHKGFDDRREQAGASTPASRRYARIILNWGMFAQYVMEDVDLAQQFYERAVRTCPIHPRSLGTLANFLHTVRHEYDRAEACYREALRARPDHASNLGNFATFLSTVRADSDAAEALYAKAVELDPSHARNLRNYAAFLENVRGELRESGRLVLRANARRSTKHPLLTDHADGGAHQAARDQSNTIRT